MAGEVDHLLSEGHEELLPRRSLALWFSGVMSVPPRDTLLGATGKNSHKNLGSRGGSGEPCALSEKTVIQGKEIKRGTDSYRAWNDTKVWKREKFPDTVDSRMVSPGAHGVNTEEGRRQDLEEVNSSIEKKK